VEPGVKAIEKYVDQVWSRGLLFHSGAKGCIQCMPPGFSIGVITLEQVIKVFDWMGAQDAGGWLE
jgi:hypothetical protein